MKEKIIQILDMFYAENRGQLVTQWNFMALKLLIEQLIEAELKKSEVKGNV